MSSYIYKGQYFAINLKKVEKNTKQADNRELVLIGGHPDLHHFLIVL